MEVWKQINNRYEVSSLGRIYDDKKGYILEIKPNSHGYEIISMMMNGVTKNRSVHSIVARYFLGPRPKGMEINHKDGKKTNNRVENLEYVTGAENIRHCLDNGLYKTKLTRDQVKEIRRTFKQGRDTIVGFGARYGVHWTTISLILRRQRWKHV